MIAGYVEHGKQVGRTLGFPTANLCLDKACVAPPRGVYAAYAWMNGKRYVAVMNVGKHPTLPEGPPTIEAHLLGATGDFYGAAMRIDWFCFLRPERRFESVEALRAQLQFDVSKAEQFTRMGR